MCADEQQVDKQVLHRGCGCGVQASATGISRRGFLGGLGGAATGVALAQPVAHGGLTLTAAEQAPALSSQRVSGAALPSGSPLRLKPVLTYQIDQPAEKTSWRAYGSIQTQEALGKELRAIEAELKGLAARAEFPIEMLPLTPVSSDAQAKEVAQGECDAMLIYGAGGPGTWLQMLTSSGRPSVLFLRQKSKTTYLWHEIAHWRFLRQSMDSFSEPNMNVDDVVVDDYEEVLWRLRAIYGLKNAKGTKMLSIGPLSAYSAEGQANGPAHAKEVWGYQFEIISEAEFAKLLQAARADGQIMAETQRQADELLGRPNVTLKTQRKFVVNSLLGLRVCKDLAAKVGATNFGFANCMGRSVIEMLDTPPCLILAMANDAGLTAYCHTDLTHTLPGVLLRWISGKPTFVCNSHWPGRLFSVAHCAAPMKMNGKDYETTTIMTHYESDYGAATKVQYPKGQTVTVIVPNLRLTKWLGFRGQVVDSPHRAACRSQMDIEVDGDCQKLLREMEGFHTQVCYGDYLREVGYALGKLGKIQWENISPEA